MHGWMTRQLQGQNVVLELVPSLQAQGKRRLKALLFVKVVCKLLEIVRGPTVYVEWLIMSGSLRQWMKVLPPTPPFTFELPTPPPTVLGMCTGCLGPPV